MGGLLSTFASLYEQEGDGPSRSDFYMKCQCEYCVFLSVCLIVDDEWVLQSIVCKERDRHKCEDSFPQILHDLVIRKYQQRGSIPLP